MRQAINYRLPIFRNMLLTQQKSNFWLEYIFAFELSSHFAFFHFVQITWSTVCMISALAYLNTNFFRQSSNFSLSSYSSYLHSNMYVCVCVLLLLLSLFELHLHLRDMIRDFSQEKTHKIAIRKLSSVCIFACLPIRSNSIKSNCKINTANIYLTTNFDQIIDTGVTDIERKKKPGNNREKEASRRTFFLL